MKRDVLLLNASEEILGVVDWRKAVCLLCNGKAIKPYNYDHEYIIKGVSKDYHLPAAIVLVKYIRLPHKSSPPTRRNILRRDDYVCQYCEIKLSNSTKRTIDHILPISRGGGNTWTNLVASCHKCNNRKGNRTPKEANMKLKRKPFVPKNGFLYLVGLNEENKTLWRRWLNV
tara:strand:- start:558 stop:1073 length:516 start_codon:yes stop_codon:yes gene_type:complete